MEKRFDMEKVAKGLGAQRVGVVHSSGGYFGAMQVAAEVAERCQSKRDANWRTW